MAMGGHVTTSAPAVGVSHCPRQQCAAPILRPWRPIGHSGLLISNRRVLAASGKNWNPKGSAGEELLDFMYAGKKLRKWYGEEGLVRPQDGGPRQDDDPEEPQQPDQPREFVMVLDADSPTGEQVVLQLILARQQIKAVVSDAAAAAAGFGPYITPVQGTPGDRAILQRAMQGVKALIVPGKVGASLDAAAGAGVPHVVLLSAVGAPKRGFGALFGGGELSLLGDPQREQSALRSGLAVTVVQVGGLVDEPSGAEGILLSEGSAPSGEICREDAAAVLARAAAAEPPPPGTAAVTVLQARNGGSSGDADWQAALDGMLLRQLA